MAIIYLAGPYTDPDFRVREERFRLHAECAGFLMSDHDTVFSPVAQGHVIATFSAKAQGFSHPVWMRHCRAMLGCCDHMYVLPLKGWKESKGLAEELDLANSIDMPMVWLQGHSLLDEISDNWLTRHFPSAAKLTWRS